MTTSQIIACAISWTAAIVAITELVLARRARCQPVRWETDGGMVTFDRKLTEEEMEQFRTRWLERHGTPGSACPGYRPPATPDDSGLCARCGMYDYKHEEQPSA